MQDVYCSKHLTLNISFVSDHNIFSIEELTENEPSTASAKQGAKIDKRQMTCMELLTTESNYRDKLKILVEVNCSIRSMSFWHTGTISTV